MRLGGGNVKGLDDSSYKFQIGKGNTLKQGKDLVIFATGGMVQESLKAVESITDLDITVVNISSLKPLDNDLIIDQVKKNGAVVTAEDHNRIGGLGDAVAEVLLENDLNVPFKKIAVNDTFAETGSAEQLYEKYAKIHTEGSFFTLFLGGLYRNLIFTLGRGNKNLQGRSKTLKIISIFRAI